MCLGVLLITYNTSNNTFSFIVIIDDILLTTLNEATLSCLQTTRPDEDLTDHAFVAILDVLY